MLLPPSPLFHKDKRSVLKSFKRTNKVISANFMFSVPYFRKKMCLGGGAGGGGGSFLPCPSASYGLEIMLLTFTNIGSVNYRKGKVIFDKHHTVKRDKTYSFIFFF